MLSSHNLPQSKQNGAVPYLRPPSLTALALALAAPAFYVPAIRTVIRHADSFSDHRTDDDVDEIVADHHDEFVSLTGGPQCAGTFAPLDKNKPGIWHMVLLVRSLQHTLLPVVDDDWFDLASRKWSFLPVPESQLRHYYMNESLADRRIPPKICSLTLDLTQRRNEALLSSWADVPASVTSLTSGSRGVQRHMAVCELLDQLPESVTVLELDTGAPGRALLGRQRNVALYTTLPRSSALTTFVHTGCHMADLPLLLGAMPQNGLQKLVLHVVIPDDDCLRSMSDLDDIHMADMEITMLEIAIHGRMAHMAAFVLADLLDAFLLPRRSFTLILPLTFSWAEVNTDEFNLDPSQKLQHLAVLHQAAEFPIDRLVDQLPVSLESLHLVGCCQAPALATLAAHLPRTLRELSLAKNGLNAQELGPLLKKNIQSLRTLDISYNALEWVPATLPPVLEHLILRSNVRLESMGSVLLDGAWSSPLRSIDLQFCALEDGVFARWLEPDVGTWTRVVCKKTKVPLRLYMGGNRVSEGVVRALRQDYDVVLN
ncbi:hypothetical protein GGF32_000975 [Allomyces javanicus]|nr:hypothetical protein GGF32_000975 [Allomyces javanicus]